jgi:hypothetical protein
MKNTKSALALFITVVAGLAGAILPLYGAYQLWVWIISQVPIASESAGLIKIVITLGMIFFGGGAVVVIAFLCGLLATTVVGFITGLIR